MRALHPVAATRRTRSFLVGVIGVGLGLDPPGAAKLTHYSPAGAHGSRQPRRSDETNGLLPQGYGVSRDTRILAEGPEVAPFPLRLVFQRQGAHSRPGINGVRR